MVELIEDSGFKCVSSESRLENQSDIANELEKIKPNYVLCCAGIVKINL